MSLTIVKYVLLAAMRDKLIYSLLAAMALVVSLSYFFGGSAVVEQDQFVLVYVASVLRLLFVFGVVLFVIFFIRKSFDNKDIEYLLSRPVGRKNFIGSYLLALIILCAFFSIVGGLAVYAVGKAYVTTSYLLWAYSFFIELSIMAAAALFFAMALNTPVSATIVTFAFYVLSRLIGQLIGIVTNVHHFGSYEVMSNIVKTVSLFVPRLDLMTQSSWLLYGSGDIGFVLVTVQGMIFVCVLSCASMIDFVRRQF